jgi:hypothetical protein
MLEPAQTVSENPTRYDFQPDPYAAQLESKPFIFPHHDPAKL